MYQSTDTLFLLPIGTVTNTSYNYYDSVHKFPILTSTTGNINVPLLSLNQTTTEAQALNEVYLSAKDIVVKDQFAFFPNPAKDFVYFKNAENAHLIIYNAEGKVLKKMKNRSDTVQISDLPTGVYFITAEKDGILAEPKKLIKK